MPSGHKTSGHIDDVRLAHLLADDADSLSMNRFRHRTSRSTRRPTTPGSVTRHLRRGSRSADAVPSTSAGRRGRRGAGNTGWGPRRWVIDLIDGTSNFVRGVPVWATLIGLMVEDEVVAGVVSAPALGRRWWASKGDGAFAGKGLMNAQPCRVSSIDTLARAQVSYSSLNGWQEAGRLVPFLDLLRRCWRTRGFGDFWSYMLLAEGAVDIAAEPELKLHDMAALDVIVTEAGGRFTGLNGVYGPNSGNAAATNGLLHDAVLDLIGDPDRGARDDDDEDLPDAPRGADARWSSPSSASPRRSGCSAVARPRPSSRRSGARTPRHRRHRSRLRSGSPGLRRAGPEAAGPSGDDLAGRSTTVPDVAAAPVTVVNVGVLVRTVRGRDAEDRRGREPLRRRRSGGSRPRHPRHPEGSDRIPADVAVDLPSLSDPRGSQAARWSAIVPASAVPSTLLIDRTGRVRSRGSARSTPPLSTGSSAWS